MRLVYIKCISLFGLTQTLKQTAWVVIGAVVLANHIFAFGNYLGSFRLSLFLPTQAAAFVTLLNPSFSSGTVGWSWYTDGKGEFTLEAQGVDDSPAAKLLIIQPGSNVQLYQSGLVLEAQAQYRLTFSARSSNGRDLGVFIHEHSGDFTNYGLSNFKVDLTEGWQTFSQTFVASGFEGRVEDARLRFWLAPYAQTGDEYWIDDVVLEKLSAGAANSPSPLPEPEAVGSTPVLSQSADTQILFRGDFERGTLAGFYQAGNQPNLVQAPKPVRSGRYAAEFLLDRNTSVTPFRTMLHVGNNAESNFTRTGESFRLERGQDYWIGFSVYVPQDWQADVPAYEDIVFQLQATPDAGETYRSPVFVLSIDEAAWSITGRGDTRPFTPASLGPGSFTDYYTKQPFYRASLGASLGQWTDWVFKVKFDYAGTGSVKVWRNGDQVAHKSGLRLGSNDEQGPYPSFGVYKWPWRPSVLTYPGKVTRRLLYLDEFRIGGAHATYADVASPGAVVSSSSSSQPEAPEPQVSASTPDQLVDTVSQTQEDLGSGSGPASAPEPQSQLELEVANNSSGSSQVDIISDRPGASLNREEVKSSRRSSEEIRQFVQIEKSRVSVDNRFVRRVEGRILLQVERRGEAWYVDPVSRNRFYLADGETAYQALKQFGLGISNADLAQLPIGQEPRFEMADTDSDGLSDVLEVSLGTRALEPDSDGDTYPDGVEVQNGYNPLGVGKLTISQPLANRLAGRILLQIENHGEAWYVNPKDNRRYYLANGQAAYQIMRYLSLGATTGDLRKINVAELAF